MSAQHARAARARWKDATKAERVAGTAAMRQAAAVRRAKAEALLALAERLLAADPGPGGTGGPPTASRRSTGRTGADR